jgi:hypothetical protein
MTTPLVCPNFLPFLPHFCRQLRILDIFDWNLWLHLLFAQFFCFFLPHFCRQLRILDIFDWNLWLHLLFAQIICLFCLPFVGNLEFLIYLIETYDYTSKIGGLSNTYYIWHLAQFFLAFLSQNWRSWNSWLTPILPNIFAFFWSQNWRTFYHLKVAQINYVSRNQLHCTANLNFGSMCKTAKHCWALSTNFLFLFSW